MVLATCGLERLARLSKFFWRPGFGKTELKETAMRKIHAVILAGAVVVGLGAIAGLAAFAPSLAGEKSATHKMTVQLPGGGTETIVYAGNVAPKVTFHTRQFATSWAAVPAVGWTMPSIAAFDPLIADMHRHLDMWAKAPLLTPLVPEPPLSAAALGSLPYGTSYSVVSESYGNGFCARFTQITKAGGDPKPRIVSRTSGNCASDPDKAVSPRPTQATKALDVPTMIGPVSLETM
jgi:hypothetical protein